MHSLWHSLDLYRRFIRLRVRAQMVYRVSFLLDLLAVTLTHLAEFASLALILQRFEGIGGWSLREVSFLYGMVSTAFGVMDLLFGGFDPDTFGENVRKGTLDQYLLRPVDVMVQVFGSGFWLRRLGRIGQGVAILAVGLSEVQWTLGKALYMPVVFTSMVLFFGALFMAGSTVTFWTVESIEAVNIFTYGGSEMISYPMHIYWPGLRRFFTFVVPAIFLNYAPALYFLDKPDPLGLPAVGPFLSPLVGVGTMVAALAFWQFGLRHYKSTGT